MQNINIAMYSYGMHTHAHTQNKLLKIHLKTASTKADYDVPLPYSLVPILYTNFFSRLHHLDTKRKSGLDARLIPLELTSNPCNCHPRLELVGFCLLLNDFCLNKFLAFSFIILLWLHGESVLKDRTVPAILLFVNWHFLLAIIALKWPCDYCEYCHSVLTLAHTENVIFTIKKIQYLMILKITATEIAISPSVLGSRSLYQYLTLTIFIMKHNHCSFSLIVRKCNNIIQMVLRYFQISCGTQFWVLHASDNIEIFPNPTVLQDELADCTVLVTFRATANKEVYKDKVVPPLDCSTKEGLKQVIIYTL